MRNIYKYTRLYSHADPVLSEGDIFEIRIPLNEANVKLNEANVKLNEANIKPNEANPSPADYFYTETEIEKKMIDEIKNNPKITQTNIAALLGISRSTVQRVMRELTEQGRIKRIGGTRGYWKIIK